MSDQQDPFEAMWSARAEHDKKAQEEDIAFQKKMAEANARRGRSQSKFATEIGQKRLDSWNSD